MKKKGILIEDNFDILIQNKQMQIGDITEQNQQLLILIGKGEIKDEPAKCVGVMNYLENGDFESLAREIRIQLTQDGMKVNEIKLNSGKIEIDASY